MIYRFFLTPPPPRGQSTEQDALGFLRIALKFPFDTKPGDAHGVNGLPVSERLHQIKGRGNGTEKGNYARDHQSHFAPARTNSREGEPEGESHRELDLNRLPGIAPEAAKVTRKATRAKKTPNGETPMCPERYVM